MKKSPVPELVALSLPSRLEILAVLDRTTLAVCERMEFDEDTASQVSMSVIEAGTNAVQHGNKGDSAKNFLTEFRLYPDRLEVIVGDDGGGFDGSRGNRDVTSPDHLFDMRGRGIFIMRACCDTVEYTFGADGTVCHLVKLRPPATARAADV